MNKGTCISATLCNFTDLTFNTERKHTEAATGGILLEGMFLKISQNSQESTCARVSFLIKLQA